MAKPKEHIVVSKRIKDIIASLGKKNDTYEDIIVRLLIKCKVIEK